MPLAVRLGWMYNSTLQTLPYENHLRLVDFVEVTMQLKSVQKFNLQYAVYLFYISGTLDALYNCVNYMEPIRKCKKAGKLNRQKCLV